MDGHISAAQSILDSRLHTLKTYGIRKPLVFACGHEHFSWRRPSVIVRAEDRRGSINPFGRKGKSEKEDEAKRALQSLFQGKKDSLSAYDVKPESGGGGKGGGGRGKKGLGGDGDGSSSWQPPDLRQLSINAWNRLGRSLRALLAVLGFVGIILAIPVIPQILASFLTIARMILRLDGRARQAPNRPAIDAFALAGTSNLGSHEISVISKYGNDGS